MNLYEAIGVRHSVRKYSNKEVSEKLREQLLAFAGKASPLNDRIAVAFEMIDNREKKGRYKGAVEGGRALVSGPLLRTGRRI